MRQHKLPDLGDRLVAGTLCAFLVLVTFAVYLFVLFIFLARGSEEAFLAAFSGFGFLFIAAAFLVGFFSGPERLATGFSFLWGTHSKWKQEPWRTRTMLVLFLLLVVYLAVKLQPR